MLCISCYGSAASKGLCQIALWYASSSTLSEQETHAWTYSLFQRLVSWCAVVNSACSTCSVVQVGPATGARLRALLDLADQVLYEPVYNVLRTKQQLGYTVHSFARLNYGVLGFTVAVITPKYTADTVEQRVEGFLEEFHQELKVGLGGLEDGGFRAEPLGCDRAGVYKAWYMDS